MLKPLGRTLAVLVVSTSAGTAAADWLDIQAIAASALPLTLSDPAYVQVELPVELVRGSWVRVSATVQGPPGEVRATVVAQADGRRVSFSVPTACDGGTTNRTCRTEAWIPSNADQVKSTVWSASTPAKLTGLRIQRGVGLSVDPAVLVHIDGLLSTMADLYYRSQEVDWTELRRWVAPALAAPSDLDPVPGAVRALVTVLPGGRHNSLLLKSNLDKSPERGAGPGDADLPTCRAVSGRVHLLWLPGTPRGDESLDERYVRAAQQCLLRQPRETRWIVDLRECPGGNSDLTLAAVSPLLQPGELFQWQNGAGQLIPVAISAAGVSTGGTIVRPTALPVGERSTAPLTVWIGPGTASACEVSAAALGQRPKASLAGTPSSGLSTGNEAIEVPPHHVLNLTAGRIVVGGKLLVDDRLLPDRISPSFTEAEIALELEAW